MILFDDRDILSDWALVERVRLGDEAAFDVLMGRYKRPVLDFVYRMIGDAAEAQDVAQEVFVRAWRSMRRGSVVPTRAQFSTWLFQIARHAALDLLRRRKRRPVESLDRLPDGADLAAGGTDAAWATVAREMGERIAAAVAILPEKQRAAIILSEYEGLPDARIATILKCSEKSVASRLYRARNFLRARLADLLR